jgi:2-succinyl-6-hydroxy-2,4-cyclohexadiene-1-carboxylate synthase
MRTVFVHGFTQAATSWDPVVDELGPEIEPVALDVPDDLDFVATAHALGDAGGTATYVGYSMGGRLCLRLALDRPDLVRELVLVSASPGIADPVERAARRDADDALARDVERDGVDAFLDRWLAQPLFASLPRALAGVDERRRANTVARLTHQLRALGQGAQEPLWDRLSELRIPVRIIVGSEDSKYCDIGSAMSRSIADAVLVAVSPAGHAVHLEHPSSVAHALTS